MCRGNAQITATKTKPEKPRETAIFFVLFAQIENEKSELANDNQRQQIHEARRRMPRRQYV